MGELAFEVIPGGDHTFSRAAPRAELVRRVLARLSRRFRTALDGVPLLRAGGEAGEAPVGEVERVVSVYPDEPR
jgi:hypothetical protein